MSANSIHRYRTLILITVPLLTLATYLGFLGVRRLTVDDGERSLIRSSVVIDSQTLDSLSWEDIANGRFTLKAGSESDRSELLKSTKGLKNEPTIYFRALLLLTSSNASEALEEFNSISIEAIPTAQLYAPYRLHDELNPFTQNPYLLLLTSRLDQDLVSPLLGARVMARAGRFEESLKYYLASDPKQWTAHDASCLTRAAAHSGLQSEVRRVLTAAIGGGRIPQAVRDRFVQIAFFGVGESDMKELREQFRSRVTNSPGVAAAAVASLEAIQEDRRRFLGKEYQTLLESHRQSTPTQLTSELVMMLFLAALSEKDHRSGTTWGQELKRRHPQPETARWVEELTRSAFIES